MTKEVDRQPMLLNYGGSYGPVHHYDENVSERETMPAPLSNCTITMRRYVSKNIGKARKWKLGIVREDDQGVHSWIGAVTVFNGRHNAYLRGPDGDVRFEMTGFANQSDAADALRWAISKLYP